MKDIPLPPDKSILHRILIIGSLTKSKITIPVREEEIAEDIHSTINALRQLGVTIEITSDRILLSGVGLHGLQAPTILINCGNSGTTARLLMGVLAAHPFKSTLIGDESLSKRPMKRLADILNQDLGADIQTEVHGGMPVVINGRELHGTKIELPVASAQMKSALLLAGLYIEGEVIVNEPSQSRDHTERMLNVFDDDSFNAQKEITYHVPGDISGAAFFIVAAILLKKEIVLRNVGLNPTRTRFLDILKGCGLRYEINNLTEEWGEARGDLSIDGNSKVNLSDHIFTDKDIPLIIDEIPALAVLAAFCVGDTTIRGASELRKKESDRISLFVENLRNFGAKIDEYEDGFTIHGNSEWKPKGGSIRHGGDHRIAMAFAVMALRAREAVTIPNANVVSISFPNFFTAMSQIAGEGKIIQE